MQQRRAVQPGLDELGCPEFGGSFGSDRRCSYVTERVVVTDAGPPRKPIPAPSRAIDCAEIDRCEHLRHECECRNATCAGRKTTTIEVDLHIARADADGTLLLDGRAYRIRLSRVP